VSPELLGPAEPVTVLAEPVALEQVIYNLITNALQALGQVPAAQRQLKVELSRDAGSGVLIVSDTGPGIPDEALPRLFEPFFTTRDTGLGLGLSLCETLVQGMGGQLSAGHHDPRGAQFRLSLPLAAA
jgi:C4-dicarboxylate-specific signal transduction histidine kinase